MSFLTFNSTQQVEEQNFNIDAADMHLSVKDEKKARARTLSDIAGGAGLTKFEAVEIEKRMSPEQKLARALMLMSDRESKKQRRRTSALGKKTEPSSSDIDDEKLLSYFNSMSTTTNTLGQKTVSESVFFTPSSLKRTC